MATGRESDIEIFALVIFNLLLKRKLPDLHVLYNGSDHKDFSDKKHKDKEKMKHKEGSTDKYKDKCKEKRKEEKVS